MPSKTDDEIFKEISEKIKKMSVFGVQNKGSKQPEHVAEFRELMKDKILVGKASNIPSITYLEFRSEKF